VAIEVLILVIVIWVAVVTVVRYVVVPRRAAIWIIKLAQLALHAVVVIYPLMLALTHDCFTPDCSAAAAAIFSSAITKRSSNGISVNHGGDTLKGCPMGLMGAGGGG
jgi:hypothetical protein